ncbi:hypothetical protein AMTR_s00010p00152590 [Amborella trichopoda]|uniref:Uncharacterized protein n=1 Tax=Amborella trichopoda TaxID=13333 RepID=W1NEC8_AMBTC|nr:hypothetical protein AMTR_s00010p00152590 [Amborella trichopoda]
MGHKMWPNDWARRPAKSSSLVAPGSSSLMAAGGYWWPQVGGSRCGYYWWLLNSGFAGCYSTVVAAQKTTAQWLAFCSLV